MIGSVNVRVIETQVVPAWAPALERFTREELREYAKSINVERGQNKHDTIRNLLESGRATMLVQLGD
jgi:hypothetical protein